MIAHLRGTVASRAANYAVIDVGGVGYGVWVPDRCLSGSGAGEGESPVTLFTWLSVREDALELFGFTTPQDREFFRMLIGVSGIGPKAALNVLSALDAATLARAILKGDDARLVKVPGVGKKTAARIILELKEKVTRQSAGSALAGIPDDPGGEPLDRDVMDVLDVLEGLGCRPEAARAAIDQVRARAARPLGFDDLLSESLQVLGQRKG